MSDCQHHRSTDGRAGAETDDDEEDGVLEGRNRSRVEEIWN